MKVDLGPRTLAFSLSIIELVNRLPRNMVGYTIAHQIIRSGTSIGANVQEALGGHTRSDFFYCINIAKKEARETKYWLNLIIQSNLQNTINVQNLLSECDELVAILTSIVQKSKKK